MSKYLDYGEILRLSLLSRQFRDEGVEKYLPWQVRHQAVAQVDVKTRRKGQNACYFCFRMKDSNQFQKPNTMASYARVVQRDVYTGQRVIELASETPPGRCGRLQQWWHQSVPAPVLSPLSPVLRVSPTIGMGGLGINVQPFLYGAAIDSAAGIRTTSGHSMEGVGGLASGSYIGSIGSMEYMGNMDYTTSMASMGNVGVPSAAAVGLVVHRPYQLWQPHAPGAEVGQVESFRRYCIQCALQAHLAVPGDLIEPRTGSKLWVCSCRVARSRDDDQRCPRCNRAAVYRNAVLR
ncbi:hypothetical protein SCUCBS95973_006307 [Sporothrix curviconia]|uniref:Uncharacterized protein n=1 Tax=Sporothrix curviconia TaxID=1260050 RepID=A0ABP0C6J3_9PEZI